jgi:hypothetical protein
VGYYLLDHPNPHGPHYYTTRRNPLLAIVVHITAGLEDLDATDDQSAEATARYAATTDRAVSWHSGSDSDTVLDLLPASYTAFQCRGYNSSTYGHEISKADTDWRDAPEPWRTRTLQLAGAKLGDLARAHRIPIRRCTKAELDRAIANGGPPVGFIAHAALDPTRRTDPGLVGTVDTFPWADLLAYAQEDDFVDKATFIKWFDEAIDRHAEIHGIAGGPRPWYGRTIEWIYKGARDAIATRAIVTSIAAKLDALTDVDEGEVARLVLDGLDPAAIAAAIPADLADQVADELASRLQG